MIQTKEIRGHGSYGGHEAQEVEEGQGGYRGQPRSPCPLTAGEDCPKDDLQDIKIVRLQGNNSQLSFYCMSPLPLCFVIGEHLFSV